MGNLRVRIIHVARNDGVFWANNHTGWFEPNIDPMGTKMTFGGGA
jgi:hypothetical protein